MLEENTGCLHLMGFYVYEYEGISLLMEGAKIPDDADYVEMFRYCPNCGKNLESGEG